MMLNYLDDDAGVTMTFNITDWDANIINAIVPNDEIEIKKLKMKTELLNKRFKRYKWMKGGKYHV